MKRWFKRPYMTWAGSGYWLKRRIFSGGAGESHGPRRKAALRMRKRPGRFRRPRLRDGDQRHGSRRAKAKLAALQAGRGRPF